MIIIISSYLRARAARARIEYRVITTRNAANNALAIT